ncbi:accessory Sec system translocase SecA2 [Clostridium estertheticum]|uniref:preprotein translocase subunit SecA n=1 Tax=Clostridium estertheticum TaxID=238834 RepID=UPI001C6EC7FC|nr:accessory Sec system translocase SecA2 [Clostridium estertheticum]MBW9173977.1 accessory Sec system translocase SecA2 [Clostridium estertheticum]WLC77628.1 accessory Sec system translocase SecA2 [Clostridium estertheticum]
MAKSMLKKIEDLSSKAEYNDYKKITYEINHVKFDSLNKEKLLYKSVELKIKVSQGVCIDEIMIQAYALVKEAIRIALGFEAYDEQIIAGIAMHRGRLIEMQTGEGKTIAAVFPAYLNALSGLGCHILTFNDYLAARDAVWMGPIYEMLGLTVGFVQDNMKTQDKQKAYSCDVTYITAKVAGFDYLRDSICYEKSECIQRPFNFVIVDEADSIIIDEAKIPLVIAAGGYQNDNTLSSTMDIIKGLKPKIHYDKDEYERNAFLTEIGLNLVEAQLCCDNLYSDENIKLLNEVHNTLYAEVILKKDIDYIVRNNKIEMVDEFTGRIAENRHWPDQIQEALEAKEKLEFKSKGRIMNQITLQSFIMLYKKVAGMTATAMDSAEEISEFYGLEVFVIPSHVPCNRIDYPDVIFTHKEAKYKALINEIRSIHATGQPILIGNSSVLESDYLALKLKKLGIECQVLNAKNDELEAEIIEQAGVIGAVTVSTNMAGRGADIKLGGTKYESKDKVIALGGLYVIGTNRYESKRIDKQLRGRAGRQGDVGMFRFFISLEDDLIKKYGIDKIIPAYIRPKNQEEPIDDPRIARKIDQVQRIIQGQNSDLRRALWKYSSLLESHRLQVYNRRLEILEDIDPLNVLENENQKLYKKLNTLFGEKCINKLEKQVALYNIDESFANYLAEVVIIQEGINLNIIGGKNPLRVLQRETNLCFNSLQPEILENILMDFTSMELSESGILSLRQRIEPPTSTWTYLVKDNAIMDSLSSILTGSLGGGSVRIATFAGAPIVSIIGFIKKNSISIRNKFKFK